MTLCPNLDLCPLKPKLIVALIFREQVLSIILLPWWDTEDFLKEYAIIFLKLHLNREQGMVWITYHLPQPTLSQGKL